MKPLSELDWLSWKHTALRRPWRTKLERNDRGILFSDTDLAGSPRRLLIVDDDRFSLGLDVIRYSVRSWEGQAFLSLQIAAIIEHGIDLLRACGMLGDQAPEATVDTGDGAILIFNSLQDLLNMLFTLNTLFHEINHLASHQNPTPINEGQPHAVLPCHVRYAIACGRAANIGRQPRAPYIVGGAVSTCMQLLDSCEGPQVLVHEPVAAALQRLDGFPEGGLWSNRLLLHPGPSAGKRSRPLTSCSLSGAHGPGPLPSALLPAGELDVVPGDPATRRYTIGGDGLAAIGDRR